MRILMILESDFAPHGGGGAEAQVRTLAHHLIAAGHRVTVLTPMLPSSRQRSAERCQGIPVARVRYPRRRLVGGGVMCLRFALFLWRRRRRYDALHVHIAHHLGAVACALGPLLGKPVIVKVSGWWELERGLLAPDRGVLGAIAARLLRRATVMQAISTRVAAELEKHGFGRERVVVLPNGVDTERFAPRTSARRPAAPFVALFVGRLVAEKGLSTLLEAWADAFRGRADVRLELVGGGPLEGELRAQAARAGIAEQVRFLGHRERVEEVIAGADLGIVPSRIEGLSNTMLEFMASGLPVLATRVSGSEDFVVTGRNGWLVPVGDEAALATALREAAALPAARLAEMGRSARADVESTAGVDRVAERLLTLYRRS